MLNITPWWVFQELTFSVASLRHLTMSTLRLATRRYRMKFTGIFASEWAGALFATRPEIERKAVGFARFTLAFHLAALLIGALLSAWWLPIVLTGAVFVGRWLFTLIVMPQHFGLMDSVPDFRMTTRSIKLNPFTSFLYLAHELACRAPHVRRRALLPPQEAGRGDRSRHAAAAHPVAGVGGDDPERPTPAARPELPVPDAAAGHRPSGRVARGRGRPAGRRATCRRGFNSSSSTIMPPTVPSGCSRTSLLGQGQLQIILVLGIAGGISGSRIARSAVIRIKENVYVQAAQAIGVGTGRTIFRHVLPNIMAPMIVIFTVTIGDVIIAEASLTFLGLGLPPDVASWGGMLSWEGRRYMERVPALALWPGLCLFTVVWRTNMFGDALRDLLDPSLRGGVGRYEAHGTKPKKTHKNKERNTHD